jgi:hypothetical protein
MKRSCRDGLRLILCIVFATATLVAGDLLWDNDFSRGMRGWLLGRNATLKREGATMFVRLIGPEGDGIANSSSPIVQLDGAEHEYELTCTYRTDVAHSQLHGGAWFIFYKLDADEKLIGDWTGMILKPAQTWTTATARINIPEGTETFKTDIRIQGREGRILDVRAVTLRRLR